MAARSSFCQRVCSSAERSEHKVKNTRRVYTARPELFWVRDQGGDNSGSVLLLYWSSGTQGECFARSFNVVWTAWQRFWTNWIFSPSHLFHLISRGGVSNTKPVFRQRKWTESRRTKCNRCREVLLSDNVFFKYLVLVLGKFIKEVS